MNSIEHAGAGGVGSAGGPLDCGGRLAGALADPDSDADPDADAVAVGRVGEGAGGGAPEGLGATLPTAAVRCRGAPGAPDSAGARVRPARPQIRPQVPPFAAADSGSRISAAALHRSAVKTLPHFFFFYSSSMCPFGCRPFILGA